MNVFHKVLVKIFEISGGKEKEDVDLIDLTKREGFFSNIDNISKQLQDEGWIAESSPQYTVRITHWGIAEAKRVLSDSPDKVNEVEKLSARFTGEARELLVMVEEFGAGPEKGRLDNIDKRLSSLIERSKAIRSHL